MKSFLFYSTLFFLCFCSRDTTAQEYSSYGKMLYTPSMGIYHSFSELKENPNTDELINFSKSNSFSEIFSFSYYFNKNWGVGVKFRANYGKKEYERSKDFNDNFQNRFAKDYFIRKELSLDEEAFLGDYGAYLFGIEYRITRNKWEITPALYVGGTEIYFSSYFTGLKKEGSHELLTYVVENKNPKQVGADFQNFLTFSPSVRLAYRLNQYLLAYSSVQFTTFKPEFTITETIENHLKETTEIIETKYDQRLNSMAMGFGFILEVGRLRSILHEKRKSK